MKKIIVGFVSMVFVFGFTLFPVRQAQAADTGYCDMLRDQIWILYVEVLAGQLSFEEYTDGRLFLYQQMDANGCYQ